MMFFECLEDSYAFRNIEERWPIFKEEPCNARLSLVADGVNPFGEVKSIYIVCNISHTHTHTK
jgi:hypothetical protein